MKVAKSYYLYIDLAIYKWLKVAKSVNKSKFNNIFNNHGN